MAHMLPFSATASVDGRLLIWDTATLSVRATCQHPEVCSAPRPCSARALCPDVLPLLPFASSVPGAKLVSGDCDDCVSNPR